MKFIYICVFIPLLYSCSKHEINKETDLVKDIDGNEYKTVTLGLQTWMAENLRTTKYNDNTTIENVFDSLTVYVRIEQNTIYGFASYNNTYDTIIKGIQTSYINSHNEDTIIKFGRLYNSIAVNTEKLCPEGWKVPSIDDWYQLNYYIKANPELYGKDIQNALASSEEWKRNDMIDNFDSTLILFRNSTGFNAYPAGQYVNQAFQGLNFNTVWWSSTSYYGSGDRAINITNYLFPFIYEDSPAYTHLKSVRCLKID